ncbi:methylation-associated defense system ATP-binding protein MAD8 [Deinococcus sp. PESE-13]
MTKVKKGMRAITAADMNTLLASLLAPELLALMQSRDPGHCMRVTDLNPELAVQTCALMRQAGPAVEAYVLVGEQQEGGPNSVTGTRLVELRNPLTDGTLRPPLLVFIPAGLHASAEDSFSVATFENVAFDHLYEEARDVLLSHFPPDVRALTEAVLNLNEAKPSRVDVVRYLLTIALNDHDASVVGAALYELHLLPDFTLHQAGDDLALRLRQNWEKAKIILDQSQSERHRALAVGVTDLAFRQNIANSLLEFRKEGASAWLRHIATDSALWPLAFDRWPLPDAVAQDKIFIQITGTSLPVATEGMPGLQAGEPYLPIGDGALKKFRIDFKTDPAPNQLPKISKFVLEIISQDQGPAGVLTTRKAWPKGDKAYAEFAMTKLARAEWGPGLHYVRIRPYAADGSLIDIVDEDDVTLPWTGSQENQSRNYPNELWFFVSSDVEPEDAPPQRAVPRLPSLSTAWLQLKASENAQQRKRPVTLERLTYKGEDGVFEAFFGRDGMRHIVAPAPLVELERQLMALPPQERLSVLTVLPKQRTYALGSDPQPGITLSSGTRTYLAERQRFLELVRGPQGEGLVSALNFLDPEVQQAVRRLVQTYQEALQALCTRGDQEALLELRQVLTFDTLRTVITQQRSHKEVLLIAPTHPMKLLWTATWAALGQQWTQESLPTAVREFYFSGLRPHSFPILGAKGDGSLLLPITELAAGWTLCTAPAERDPRGVLSDLCAGLQLPEPVGEDGLRAEDLARRLRRYLIQHPYLSVLTINAFNAGQAGLLADALVVLQKSPELRDMAYDVRLFVDDPLAAGVGQGLLNLLNHSGKTTDRNAEAFGTSTGDTLRPKLGLAIRPFSEFQRDGRQHGAHISLLFDLFPAGEIKAQPARDGEHVVPFHGLVQDYSTSYTENDELARWERQPIFGMAEPLTETDDLTPYLSSLPKVLAASFTAVATGEHQPQLRPTVTLTLGSEQRALLHQIHEVSDWVITIDRNLGVEFFDHGRQERPEYLIDHASKSASNYQLVVSSRENEELEVMLRPVLREYGLPEERALATLTALHALSGRLALKLLSTSNEQAEVLGLALAKLFLEYQGALQNQLIVPLDTHPELNQTEDALDLHVRRTDLALIDLDTETRTVTMRLVEVKSYRQIYGLLGYEQLKHGIAEQIRDSEVRLQRLFGPQRREPHPALAPLRARQLAELLLPYLERAQRYNLIDQEAYDNGHILLGTLQEGYDLNFERSAFIFDFSADHYDQVSENGIEYHRVGRDAILDLMAIAPEQRGQAVDLAATVTATLPKLNDVSFQPRRRTLSSPRLEAHDKKANTTPTLPVSHPAPEPVIKQLPLFELEAQSERPTATPIPPDKVSPLPEQLDEQLESPRVGLEPEITLPVHTSPLPAEQTHTGLLDNKVSYDVVLGTTKATPQFGLLGEVAGRKVALDLNETHTISLFGVQGGGKSYTLGSIIEMATMPIPGINQLPSPLASVIFHYSNAQEYAPEFISMMEANPEAQQLATLKARYGADGHALQDILLLAPQDKVEERQREYPNLTVRPLLFSASELQVSHWQFLLNAVGNNSMYMRQFKSLMREHRKDLKISVLREAVENSTMTPSAKELALARLDLASDYIHEDAQISSFLVPGRLIIVDLRDEFIEKSEALSLFVILLQLFADAKADGQAFNKLVVFDEAHKYIDDPELIGNVVEIIREMRHKGTSILLASQDPSSVPVKMIELSTQIILHKFNSPAWLRHIQKANAALASLTPNGMAELKPGEAYIWSSKATDGAFTSRAMKMSGRPRVSRHGGDTKKAVDSKL